MIITITLNPAVDKTVEINDFTVGCVNRVSSVRTDAGGKGINVSKVILSLGGESRAVGLLGGTNGSFIKEHLDQLEIMNKFHFIHGETRTNLKIIDILSKINTDINEPGQKVEDKDIETLRQLIFNHLHWHTINKY